MSETKGISLSVMQLENYAAPEVTETVSKNWIRYGDDNDYFGYLTDRFRGSPTNHAIINGVAQMIFGKGLTSDFASQQPEKYAAAKALFNDEETEKIAFDLKAYGFFIMTGKYDAAQGKIIATAHTPVINWRSGKADENGDVKEWFYSDNWQKTQQARFKPVPYPVFDPDNPQEKFIWPVLPYRAGTFYYPTVDYMGGLQWAHLEEEVSNFHLNNIFNGLFPQLLINFNQGDPGEEERKEIERKIRQKWAGSSNAGRFILSFNDNKDNAATIEAPPLNDLDKMYEFLSGETTTKIMVAHRVTTPLLFGIRGDGGGLGNNAQELETGYQLFENTVIQPYRKTIIDAYEEILAFNGQYIPLKLESLQPVPQQTNLSAHKPHGHKHEMSEEDAAAWLAYLEEVGEWLDPEQWECIDEQPVTNIEMAEPSARYADPEERSEQDGGLYKIRYAYAPQATSNKTREFCNFMVNLAKANIVYRKEDIIEMGDAGVNDQFAPKGSSTYSIWLYKGGVNCHHYWARRVYMRKRNAQGQFLPPSESAALENDKRVTVAEARKAGVPIPKNEPQVAVKPINMPNGGRKN